MGNDAVNPPNFAIIAEPLCTSAQGPAPAQELTLAIEPAFPEPKASLISGLFSRDPLQSLLRQTQLFSSAKNLLNSAEDTGAIPLACTYVNVSGSGSFGDVQVGYSSSRSIMISNPCSCPVNFYVAGAPYGFTLSSSGGSISANGSTSISVTFNPQSEQSYSGSISITPGGSSISLSGRGIRR